MLKNIELTGKLLDSSVIRLILELRGIKNNHKIGSSYIEANGNSYDARLIYATLEDLESVANECNLKVNEITSSSSLDELLGSADSKLLNVKTTLQSWELLENIDRVDN